MHDLVLPHAEQLPVFAIDRRESQTDVGGGSAVSTVAAAGGVTVALCGRRLRRSVTAGHRPLGAVPGAVATVTTVARRRVGRDGAGPPAPLLLTTALLNESSTC